MTSNMYAVIQDDEVVDYFSDLTAAYNEAFNLVEREEKGSIYVVDILKRFD